MKKFVVEIESNLIDCFAVYDAICTSYQEILDSHDVCVKEIDEEVDADRNIGKPCEIIVYTVKQEI